MKKISCLFLFMIIASLPLLSQTDSALLKEVNKLLSTKKASVSSILSSKTYLRLHPESSFRELISQYASAAPLTITTPEEPGKKIKVLVTVQDENGNPIPNSMIYLYQTDARGWYAADAPHILAYEGDIRHARLFGYALTDANGKMELHTVKPSGYPKSDLPAHIHIHFSATGFRSSVTELLFDDDERLVGDIRTQSIGNRFLISKPEPASAPFSQQFSYIVTLLRP